VPSLNSAIKRSQASNCFLSLLFMDARLDTHSAAAIWSNHQLAGSARTWITVEAEPR
jgi:hypothetical protein